MKQIQDAYIVAATRTPIGRSHRGSFRTPGRMTCWPPYCAPRWRRRRGSTRSAVEDVVCGCAIPEAQQGQRRAHRCGAGGAAQERGRHHGQSLCASGLSAVQMAADRIRVGEADVMIAAGTESMSMVPMMGNCAVAVAGDLLASRTTSRATASPTAWASRRRRSRSSGRSRAKRAGRVRLPLAHEGDRGDEGRRVQRRDHPGGRGRAVGGPRVGARSRCSTRTVDARRGRAARHHGGGAREAQGGVRGPRLR